MPTNPKRTVLQLARQKLDAVATILDRRQLQHLIRSRSEEIDSVHAYSDASPVTGKELQGMVLDIISISGALTRYIMVGVMLHFGGTRLVDKAIAFVWSLILMIGIDIDDLVWFLGRFFSFTTDMGTESGLAAFQNI